DDDLLELVALAAKICDSGSAGITIRRDDEYHVPITYGIDPLVCRSDDTFCRYTMGTDGVFVIEDARTDARFAEIGWVDGTLADARFYASAPIYAPGGQMVGRLCVIDSTAKTLTPLQQRSLESLALSVTTLLELRLLQASRVSRISPEVRQTAATLMSQLSAELSHDMRVPLSAILASVEMLQDQLTDHPDPAVGALLSRCMGAARRMERMLDQNMGFDSVLARGTVCEVDLRQVAAQLRLDSLPMLEATGATLETDDLPVVRADPDDMYSVLQNLVTNAVKFARPGVPARVRISSRRVPEGWRISVHDNGVGIPEERRVDVFSLFTRGETEVAGHGIGLATVSRIVSAHGGHFGAEEAPGGGSEIWFELPDAGTRENADGG
ncbi:MAG TPA: HAMP domain-containing sensor histidine kinase, partial [Propionicimonas sp.]|nr:HAMP domain-containing sensor histidine kinase [Propionicimonas sp.]